MKNSEVQWLIGSDDIVITPLPPYSDIVIRFLDELSGVLRKEAAKEGLPDVQSLAFWCRKGNLLKLKEQARDYGNALGRGLVFHITPSNVPVNFAFSFFFGLLAGNANLVRVPSKEYRQVDTITKAIQSVLENPEYKILKEGNAFVRYGHNQEVTDEFSARADGRIIWGGDEAIRTIRLSPLKIKGVEIVFADRYSLGVMDTAAVLQASDTELKELARHFYNDTFLMDQNACSTPHLLLWMGSPSEQAKEIFWNAVCGEAQRYSLEPIKAVDKYTDFCMMAMSADYDIRNIKMWGNLLYTVELGRLPEDICAMRGRFGMFYQYDLNDLAKLASLITERVQTLLYYGVDKQVLLDFVLENRLPGIDRIVPFGRALDMNVYWDGYDIIRQLSRSVQVE